MLTLATRLRHEAEALRHVAAGFTARAETLTATNQALTRPLAHAPLTVSGPRASASIHAWRRVAEGLRPASEVLGELARRAAALGSAGNQAAVTATELEAELEHLEQRRHWLMNAGVGTPVGLGAVELALARTRRALEQLGWEWDQRCRAARQGLEELTAQLGAIERGAALPLVGAAGGGRVLDGVLARTLLYVPSSAKHLRTLSGGSVYADAWMRSGHVEFRRGLRVAGGLAAAPLRGSVATVRRHRVTDSEAARWHRARAVAAAAGSAPLAVLDEASAAVVRADHWARSELHGHGPWPHPQVGAGGVVDPTTIAVAPRHPALPPTPTAMRAAIGTAGAIGVVGDVQVIRGGSQYDGRRGQIDEVAAVASVGGVSLAATAKAAGVGATITSVGKLAGLTVLGVAAAPLLIKVGIVAGAGALLLGAATTLWGLGNLAVDTGRGLNAAAERRAARRPNPVTTPARHQPAAAGRAAGPAPAPSTTTATSARSSLRPPGPPLADQTRPPDGFDEDLVSLLDGSDVEGPNVDTQDVDGSGVDSSGVDSSGLDSSEADVPDSDTFGELASTGAADPAATS